MAVKTKIKKIPIDREKTKEQREYEGIRVWTDYWRQNPHRWVADWAGYEGLTWWQDMVLYLMFKLSTFFWITARGLSKSYMVAWFLVARCILYPRSRFVIGSSTRSEAILIISQKILGELSEYPAIANEIADSKTVLSDTYVKFKNGSEVVVVTGGDSSRGNRACGVIYEEANRLTKYVVESVLSNFKNNGDRRPRWKNNPKYRRVPTGETKQDIFISSAWFANEYFHNRAMDSVKAMVAGRNEATISMHWGFSVIEGFMNYENDILQKKESSEFSDMWWSMENEGLFWNDAENSVFTYNSLIALRKHKEALRPIPNELFADARLLEDWKKKNLIAKGEDELRLLCIDVAVVGGGGDNTVFSLLSLKPKGNKYKMSLEYMEHMSGGHGETQGIRAKQLHSDFDVDIVCIDINGAGFTVYDAVSKEQKDIERGVEYPAWVAYNKDNVNERVYGVEVEDALPIVYAVMQNEEMNHLTVLWMRNAISERRIDLLIDSGDARDNIISKLANSDGTYDENETLERLKPYYETDMLIKEMTSLELKKRSSASPYLSVTNKSGRKDRYSSFSFGVYLATQLEADLREKKKSKSSLTSFIAYN